MLSSADLPDDIVALKAMLIAATAREARKDERIERLERLVAAFNRRPSGANPRRPIPINSTLRWRIWKRPSRPSRLRTTPTLLRGNVSPYRAQPIAALCPNIFPVSKR